MATTDVLDLNDLPAGMLTAKVLATDVDGTLASGDTTVSDRSVHAIRQLKDAGLTPIIITGRMLAAARSPLDRADVEGMVVACGGAVVCDTASGELLSTISLSATEVGTARDLARDNGLAVVIFGIDELVTEHPTSFADFLSTTNDGMPVTTRSFDDLPDHFALKVMLGGEKDQLDEARDAIVGALPRMTRSLDCAFEMSPEGADKSHGLQLTLQRLGIDPADCIGIGDGDNDVAWLQTIGWPLAVSNARGSLHQVARFQIGHHDEDAVACFIEALLAARGWR